MIYGYQCTKCQHKFEVIRSLKEYQAVEPCPKCNEPAERDYTNNKVFHRYNTDGFYATDKKGKMGSTL